MSRGILVLGIVLIIGGTLELCFMGQVLLTHGHYRTLWSGNAEGKPK